MKLNAEKGDKMKRTLIVVDMQNDFIFGSLGTKEAIDILPKVKSKIAEYKARGEQIIFTRDTHFENYFLKNEGKHLPIIHCLRGTWGWQIADGLGTDGCECVDKVTFAYDKWYAYDFENVEIVGLCTDICVISNALAIKMLYPEIDITVDASCCAGVTPETHKSALKIMKMCCIDVIGE